MFRPALVATRFSLAVACAPLVALGQAALPAQAPPIAPAAPVAPAATPAPLPPEPPTAPEDSDRHVLPIPSQEERAPFRHTWITWDHTVSAQTIGIGRSYQSNNPTYTMSGAFQPRYYPYDGEKDAIYIDGRIDLIREFTNSDVTTRQGEFTLSDATVALGYARMLHQKGDYATLLSIRAPGLTFPTSKFSFDNGTILGVGGELRFAQEFPLAGSQARALKTALVRLAASYTHTFTRATTPTDEALHRVRLESDGRTVPGDQLTGVAFPEHQVGLVGRGYVNLVPRLVTWFEVAYLPTWKYGFASADVCSSLTGCAPAARPNNPNRYVPTTGFQAEVMFDVLPEVGMSVGYINVETQPGLDGQRRSIFYSPGAQFYLEFTAYLDAIYDALSGNRADYSSGLHLAL